MAYISLVEPINKVKCENLISHHPSEYWNLRLFKVRPNIFPLKHFRWPFCLLNNNKQIFACLFSVNRVMIILLLEKLILAETAFIRIVMQLDAEIKQS